MTQVDITSASWGVQATDLLTRDPRGTLGWSRFLMETWANLPCVRSETFWSWMPPRGTTWRRHLLCRRCDKTWVAAQQFFCEEYGRGGEAPIEVNPY